MLSVKPLKPLGHIFNFATLRIKCCRQHFMREIRLSGSEGGGTEFSCFSLPLSEHEFSHRLFRLGPEEVPNLSG